jgi:hypothetical protein
MRSLPSLLAPLLGACVATYGTSVDATFTSTNRPPRPLKARAFDSVEIYTTSSPPRPYAEVGLLRAIERGNVGPQDWAIASMRTKAAEVGCDGIIITGALVTEHSGASQVHHSSTCFLYAADTTWKAPAQWTGGASGTKPDGSPDCDAMLTEVRRAPNDAKASLVQLVPPECYAAPERDAP